MTEPIAYVRKDPTPIQAMFFDGTTQSATDIADWVLPFLGENATVSPGPYNTSLLVVDGEFYLAVPRDAYIYQEGDGFHAAEKSAFELLLKVDDGV